MYLAIAITGILGMLLAVICMVTLQTDTLYKNVSRENRFMVTGLMIVMQCLFLIISICGFLLEESA